MSKKVLAVVLSLIIAFSIVAVPVGAADASESVGNIFNVVIEKIINLVLKYLNKYLPGYEGGWNTSDEYVTDNFYSGNTAFDKTAGSGWKVGYASASLLDGIDAMNGKFFLAGSLEPVAGRVPSKILDDQRVRVYAISDGTGGTAVHAVIDGFGLARGDVQEIRARFEEFATANNVTAVNVSVLHQHSCIDTLGMNVPLAQALLFNSGNAATGGALENQKVENNKVFMENLYNKTVFSMKKAVMGMKEGNLFYGTADVSNYIRDKRDPQAFDGNIHRLRFVPNDNTAETWIVEAGIHTMSFGAGGDKLTGDFPYYIEKALKEYKGINLVYIQGAELAISMRTVDLCEKCGSVPVITRTDDTSKIACKCGNSAVLTADEIKKCDAEKQDKYVATVDKWNVANNSYGEKETVVSYGVTIAEKLKGIKNEEKLSPVLNVAMKELRMNVTNQILTLAAREDILNSVIVRNGDGYQLVTEIGYMELGNSVGIFLCPGELDPSIAYGGPESGDAAWLGGEWKLPTLKDITPCKNVMVVGLCNDQGGYILRDNEYHSILSENEEVNVVSTSAGSTIVNGYTELLRQIEKDTAAAA